jgi:transcriptional regulator with XRE-family HTH domain
MQPGSAPRRGTPLPRGRLPNQLDPSSSAAARFGAELRALRLDARLTIKALGKLIGFSPTRISEVENGKGKLSREFVDACERTMPANGTLITLFESVVEEETAARHARLATRRRSQHAKRPAATPVRSYEMAASVEPASSQLLLGPQGVLGGAGPVR